jgi:ferrochelatase
MKHGLLLINLGTPEHCDTASVRRYLREFLMDPRVITLPWLARALLVYGIILPFQAKRSAKAYQSIWHTKGSPLRYHSLELAKKIAAQLNQATDVALGMRYGTPSIKSALAKLNHCDKITILSLFPQYAESSSGSAIAQCKAVLKGSAKSLTIIDRFYNHPDYIACYTKHLKQHIPKNTDAIIFSYHGLPESHCPAKQCHPLCNKEKACPKQDTLSQCYRAQCFHSTRLIVEKLELNKTPCITSFQSRLGRTPWIKPYTDHQLILLRKKNIKHITVAAPSFITDCLETLEEINIRLRAQWTRLGGDTLTYIPAMNADDAWVNAITQLSQTQASV